MDAKRTLFAIFFVISILGCSSSDGGDGKKSGLAGPDAVDDTASASPLVVHDERPQAPADTIANEFHNFRCSSNEDQYAQLIDSRLFAVGGPNGIFVDKYYLGVEDINGNIRAYERTEVTAQGQGRLVATYRRDDEIIHVDLNTGTSQNLVTVNGRKLEISNCEGGPQNVDFDYQITKRQTLAKTTFCATSDFATYQKIRFLPDGSTLWTDRSRYEEVTGLWRSDRGRILVKLKDLPELELRNLRINSTWKTLSFSFGDLGFQDLKDCDDHWPN